MRIEARVQFYIVMNITGRAVEKLNSNKGDRKQTIEASLSR